MPIGRPNLSNTAVAGQVSTFTPTALGTLTAPAASFSVSDAPGTVVSALAGLQLGERLVSVDGDARVAISGDGTAFVVGSKPYVYASVATYTGTTNLGRAVSVVATVAGPAALGPTTASFNTSAATGSLVAVLTGLAGGEVATTLSPNDGRLAIAGGGTTLVTGLTASTAGTTTYTVTTSAGRSLSIAVTAVATPTLPVGTVLVTMGDSINEYEFNTGSSAAARALGIQMTNTGQGDVTNALQRDPRAVSLTWNDITDSTALLTNIGRYYAGGDVARAGAQLSDIAAEYPRAKAYAQGVIASGGSVLWIVGGGTNSLGLSDSAFQTQHAAILDAIRADFPTAQVGVQNIRATGVSQAGTRPVASIAAKNTVISNNVSARSAWATLIDNAGYADDTGNPGNSLSINFATAPYQASPGGDDLHPGPFGGATKGTFPNLAFIQAKVASGNALTARKVASLLPAGIGTNAGSQAITTRTAGTGGGNITGTEPLNINVVHGAATNASDCAVSLVANAETGGQTLRLTFTPKGTNTAEQFIIRPAGINYATTAAAGQFVRMWADVTADQGGALLDISPSTQERSYSADKIEAKQGLFPVGSGSRRWRGITTPTKRFPWGSTGVAPSMVVRIDPSLSTAVTVVDINAWDVQTEASPVQPAVNEASSFVFTDVTGATASAVVTSNTVTLAGLAGSTAILPTTGVTYSKNGAAYTSAAGTVANGDTVSLQMTASATTQVTVYGQLFIGTAYDTWAVKTA